MRAVTARLALDIRPLDANFECLSTTLIHPATSRPWLFFGGTIELPDATFSIWYNSTSWILPGSEY